MLTSEQIRAARALLRWEQKNLAAAAGVSVETIKRLEKKPGRVSPYVQTVDAIRGALETAGVEIRIPEEGLRLAVERAGRQRDSVSGRESNTRDTAPAAFSFAVAAGGLALVVFAVFATVAILRRGA